MKQVKPCPRCGATHGWWEKRLENWRQFYLKNGDPSHAEDGDSMGRGGKRKFCYECNKDITDCVEER